MLSSRLTLVHVATCVVIISLGIGVNSESEQKLCDVRMWYLDLVMDGPLTGELSEEKKVLKEKIEKMVNKYKNVGRSDGMVDCNILAVYEELLKADDKPPDSPVTEESLPGGDPVQDKGATNTQDDKPPDSPVKEDSLPGGDPVQDKGATNTQDDKPPDSPVKEEFLPGGDPVRDKGATNTQDDKPPDSPVKEESLPGGDPVQDKGATNTQDDKPPDSPVTEESLPGGDPVQDKGATNTQDSGNREQNQPADSNEKANSKSDDNLNEGDVDTDETELDETDFGDEDEDFKETLGGDVDSEKTLDEHIQDSISESEEKINGKEEETPISKAEPVTEVSDQKVPSSEGGDHSGENDKEKHKDEDDSLKGNDKVLRGGEDDTKGTQIDASEVNSYEDRIANDTNEVIKDISGEQPEEKENKVALEEENSKTTEGGTKKKKRMVEELVFDYRKGYIKVLKEVDVHEDESDKDGDEEKHSDTDTDTIDEKNKKPKEKEKEKEKEESKQEIDEKTDGTPKGQTDKGMEHGTKDDLDKKPKTNDSQSTLHFIKQGCLNRHSCDLYCYYGFSTRQCLDSYPDIASKDYDQNSESSQAMLHFEEQQMKESEDTNPASDDVTTSASEEHIRGTTHTPDTEINDQPTLDSHKSVATEEIVKEEDHPSQRSHAEQTNEKEKNNKHAEQETAKINMGKDFRDLTADLHRFELSFQQRASEYANKIQNLEIMIIKLENQLLGERLNKQNSSTSFSKLENHILRLENELLKLNQSYAYLKNENDVLYSRQRKYLELGNDKQASMNENGTKHLELITKQQTKISELSSLLMNHSHLFEKLQIRSQALEGQNQALYQIVMNQTALISSIMKKMQELSEENLKHRQETQDLRNKLEMKTNSDRLLQKLDKLVSGAIPMPRSVVDDGQPEEIVKPLNIYSFLPKSPDASVAKKPWKCDGNQSSRFCLLYSLILSPCPPFSTIYWEKCSDFFKDISQKPQDKSESDGKRSDIDETKTDSVSTYVPNSDNNIQDSHLSSTNEKGEETKVVEITENKAETDLPEKLQSGSVVTSNEETQVETNIPNTNGKKELPATKSISDSSQEGSHEEKKIHLPKGEEDIAVKDKSSTDSKADVHKGTDNNLPTNTGGNGDKSDSPDTTKDSSEAPPPSPPAEAPAADPKDRKILYTTEKTLPKPKDCYEYYMDGSTRNGMYKIHVVGLEKNLPVYCDMKNGGWTVLIKRSNGGTDFYKDWEDYKRGFGGLYSEHWIGNDNLHYITNQDHYRLRVDLMDNQWEEVRAEYDIFWIDNEDEGYRLHIGGYSGTAGDGFDKHNNMKFSTMDVDNDLVSKELKEYDSSCAKRFRSGWWYYKCYKSNLTGQYYRNGVVPDKKFDGVSWKPWKKPNISLKQAVMMIRPLSAED